MKQRSQVLSSLSEKEFDVVVIGAGLLGAGVALEAANKGFSVLVVDKEDFSSGTSSRTSKLAGGAHLLKPAGFALPPWASSVGNGNIMYKKAPHMVKDFAFVMPITTGGFFFGLKAQLGLMLEDIKAKSLGRSRGHSRLGKVQTLMAAPALSADVVKGGLSFHDTFADDSRFVLEMLKAACNKGALCANYLEAKEFESQGDEIKSIILRDRIEGKEFRVKARAIVSACGVWTESIANLIAESKHSQTAKKVAVTETSKESVASEGKAEALANAEETLAAAIEQKVSVAPTTASFQLEPIKLVRSTYIVLPPSVLDLAGALLLPASAGRYVFVVPWEKALLVGTTATSYDESPDAPVPSTEEITFLMDTINMYKRSGHRVTGSDVACAWAGLNIISTESNGGPSFFRGPMGVFIGYGGHLCDIPKMSDLALHLLTKKLGAPNNQIDVGSRQSSGEPQLLGGFADKEDYLLSCAEIGARARKLGIEPASHDHLLSNYGKDAMHILDLIEQNPALNERICPDFPPLMAEVAHCVDNEMAISLEDVLSRRLRIGLLHREQCLAAAPRVARTMQELCGWDSLRLKSELSALARNLASQLAPVS